MWEAANNEVPFMILKKGLQVSPSFCLENVGHRAVRCRRVVLVPTTPLVQHRFAVPDCTLLVLSPSTIASLDGIPKGGHP